MTALPSIGDSLARAILTTALAEGRAADLLDTLITGGSATVDPITRRLALITADQLAALDPEAPRQPSLDGVRRLVTEAWTLIAAGRLDARSPLADAALDVRDEMDPRWDPTDHDAVARLTAFPRPSTCCACPAICRCACHGPVS